MTEPTFTVQEIGSGLDTTIALVPQFQPSNLDDGQREVYDALRKAGPRHHAGAIAVNELAAAQFEAGETVTLEETTRRYKVGAREAAEAFQAFRADALGIFAPVVGDLAEACQPLVEWRQDVAEGMAENFDGDD